MRYESKMFYAMLISLLIFCFFSRVSLADEQTKFVDCSDSTGEYAKTVAKMNQVFRKTPLGTEPGNGAEIGGKLTGYVLLCRLNCGEFDFSVYSPDCIVAGPKSCYTLYFTSEEDRDKAVEGLRSTPGVLYAEADQEVYASSTDDADGNRMFHSIGAEIMNFGIYSDYVSQWGKGSVVVGVIDSGVFLHSLISPKVKKSGFDYVDADDDATNDLYGHGTNVAGIIADCTIGQPVYIYPIRVLGAGGNGRMSNVVNAVREAIGETDIINLSLESTVMSEALDDAIREAVNAGVTVVVAAGNSSCNTASISPAHMTDSGVIVVGSAEGSNGNYVRASYSNYGSSVDVYAFGTGIECCSRSGGYTIESGTSMAAPHISALCALLERIHPGISPQQKEKRIKAAAAGTDDVIIPELSAMIPKDVGFRINEIQLAPGETFLLTEAAWPETSCETILYSSSEKNVVSVEGFSITALSPGNALIRYTCTGLEEGEIGVTVTEMPKAVYVLPAGMLSLEDEAFLGNSTLTDVEIPKGTVQIGNNVFEDCPRLRTVSVPLSVNEIGQNSFSDAIVICDRESYAAKYANQLQLRYLYRDEIHD